MFMSAQFLIFLLLLFFSLASQEFPGDYMTQRLANDLGRDCMQASRPHQALTSADQHTCRFWNDLKVPTSSQVSFIVPMQPKQCEELIPAFLQLSYFQDLPVKFMGSLLLAENQVYNIKMTELWIFSIHFQVSLCIEPAKLQDFATPPLQIQTDLPAMKAAGFYY